VLSMCVPKQELESSTLRGDLVTFYENAVLNGARGASNDEYDWACAVLVHLLDYLRLMINSACSLTPDKHLSHSTTPVLVPEAQATILSMRLNLWSSALVDVDSLWQLASSTFHAADAGARSHHYTPEQRADVAELVLQLSYARIMLQEYGGIMKAERRSETFGSMSTRFVRMLLSLLHVHRDSVFLDIGSGIGNVVLQLSHQSGCSTIGVEIVEERMKRCMQLQQAVANHSVPWQLALQKPQWYREDILEWEEDRLGKLINSVDAIWMCNLVFDKPEVLSMKILPYLKPTVIVASLKYLPGFQRCVRHVRNFHRLHVVTLLRQSSIA
jgi:SAM-dependent methyltransferase